MADPNRSTDSADPNRPTNSADPDRALDSEKPKGSPQSGGSEPGDVTEPPEPARPAPAAPLPGEDPALEPTPGMGVPDNEPVGGFGAAGCAMWWWILIILIVIFFIWGGGWWGGYWGPYYNQPVRPANPNVNQPASPTSLPRPATPGSPDDNANVHRYTNPNGNQPPHTGANPPPSAGQ